MLLHPGNNGVDHVQLSYSVKRKSNFFVCNYTIASNSLTISILINAHIHQSFPFFVLCFGIIILKTANKTYFQF